jgi:hypothetical protein
MLADPKRRFRAVALRCRTPSWADLSTTPAQFLSFPQLCAGHAGAAHRWQRGWERMALKPAIGCGL